jgi:hypothetical protein
MIFAGKYWFYLTDSNKFEPLNAKLPVHIGNNTEFLLES